METLIKLVITLFTLSLISERVINWIKLYFGQAGKKLLFFTTVDEDITKQSNDPKLNTIRDRKILGLNIVVCFLVALLIHANLFDLLKGDNPAEFLGWDHFIKPNDAAEWVKYIFITILGCFMSGLCMSMGSKFWHDLLDILYQIKNTKRVLADPETYKVDNIKTLQKFVDTYQSDFIKAAYLEAKTKYMAMDNVKAIGIKSDNSGYYFEITVNKNEPPIGENYPYLLNDGILHNIRIDIKIATDEIKAHSIDLSARVFDIKKDKNWGTLGVIVKSLDNNSDKRYLLTCCHNVVNPMRTIPDDEKSVIEIGAKEKEISNQTQIGKVFKAIIDHEIDAALIEIEEQNKNISNSVPQMGNPQKTRQLLNNDAGNVAAFIYGARSGVENQSVSKGIVTSIYNTIKIKYGSKEFSLINTIAISNNGKAISQGGDSGACVLDSNNNVIGLVVAGNREVTYVLPITTLLTKLNVQLI